MVRVESFEKGTFCARTLCVKDKRGISNIMWKSTSIFIGTGRLTVEDLFCLILSINYKVGLRGEHGAIIHSVLFCSMIRQLTFCINHFFVWSTCMLSFFHWKDQQTKQWCCIMIITKKSKIDVCYVISCLMTLIYCFLHVHLFPGLITTQFMVHLIKMF